MGAAKNTAAGVIIAAGGAAIKFVGQVIFSATGATAGPIVNYRAVITLFSTGLLGLGGFLILLGVSQGIYKIRKESSDEEGEDEAGGRRDDSRRGASRNEPSRRPSGSSPPSRRDRRNSPSRG